MRARLVLMFALLAGLAALFAAGVPAAARAADCKLAEFDYNGACGPEFELPAWGNGGGWTDPSKYSTIRLADLTGNGVDELIGRNDDGIEIWWFDTCVGQWRPAIGADGLPEVLTDFRSPLPSEVGGTLPANVQANWTWPQYYTTIQTVDLNGPGHGVDIIARFPSGMRVYGYTPPAKNTSPCPSAKASNINGGTWKLISQDGPFSDKDGYTDPSLYLSIHADPGFGTSAQPARLIAQSKSGPVVYFWNGSGWTLAGSQPPGPYTNQPAGYENFTSAVLPVPGGGTAPVVVMNTGGDVVFFYKKDETNGFWHWEQISPGSPPFGRDWNSSPSYYNTLRFANITGLPGEEILGRASDGLHVFQVVAGKYLQNLKDSPLRDLAGSADQLGGSPGRWASIRTGDILGNGRDQLLALDGKALQAWSLEPARDLDGSWQKLSASVPLNLGGDMWTKCGTPADDCPNASYYSTIRVGDVIGDGHDAVIARGPFGIRTWFYCASGDTRTRPCSNLKGSSGWTSWLPQDPTSYPQFPSTSNCPAMQQCGQAAAFAKLNALAQDLLPAGAKTVRDMWTGENAPSNAALDRLKQGILGFAGCPATGNPPYPQCTPPAGTAGFTAADWTAVVNEVLSEIGSVGEANGFFDTLDNARQKMFISHGAELDAIITKLGLQGAADNETRMSPAETNATIIRLVGAIAGGIPGVGEVFGPALEIAAEFTSLLASDSPTLNSEFSVKYADLKDKFATMIGEINKGLQVQSLEVRSSYGLLSLLSQLTTGKGAWANPDMVGLESANDQGFAISTYQQLLPTLYARYKITHCVIHPEPTLDCSLTGSGPETIGAQPDFTTLGPPPWGGDAFHGGTPCNYNFNHFGWHCAFTQLHDDRPQLADKIWGPLSDTCKYQPGKAGTKWTFGCNLGVLKEGSVSLELGSASGWDFANYCGNPGVSGCQAPSSRATVGADGHVALSGVLTLPTGFRVTSATILPDRMLYEPAGPGGGPIELVDRISGRALGAVPLAARGRAQAFASAGGARASLALTATRGGHQTYDLTLSRVDVGVPDACQALPASDTLATPPFELTSTLRLSDGSRTQTVSLPALWRCVRDRAGAISELQPAPQASVTQRSGLEVSVAGPHTVSPGTIVPYLLRVRNQRRGPSSRLVSSLWHVVVQGMVTPTRSVGRVAVGQSATWRLPELQRGRLRTLRFMVHIPSSATGRVCIGALASADSARPASARLCAKVVVPPNATVG